MHTTNICSFKSSFSKLATLELKKFSFRLLSLMKLGSLANRITILELRRHPVPHWVNSHGAVLFFLMSKYVKDDSLSSPHIACTSNC